MSPPGCAPITLFEEGQFTLTPKKEQGSPEWLTVSRQLREGPNTAKTRGRLRRRRAQFRRRGLDRMWSYDVRPTKIKGTP